MAELEGRLGPRRASRGQRARRRASWSLAGSSMTHTPRGRAFREAAGGRCWHPAVTARLNVSARRARATASSAARRRCYNIHRGARDSAAAAAAAIPAELSCCRTFPTRREAPPLPPPAVDLPRHTVRRAPSIEQPTTARAAAPAGRPAPPVNWRLSIASLRQQPLTWIDGARRSAEDLRSHAINLRIERAGTMGR